MLDFYGFSSLNFLFEVWKFCAGTSMSFLVLDEPFVTLIIYKNVEFVFYTCKNIILYIDTEFNEKIKIQTNLF